MKKGPLVTLFSSSIDVLVCEPENYYCLPEFEMKHAGLCSIAEVSTLLLEHQCHCYMQAQTA